MGPHPDGATVASTFGVSALSMASTEIRSRPAPSVCCGMKWFVASAGAISTSTVWARSAKAAKALNNRAVQYALLNKTSLPNHRLSCRTDVRLSNQFFAYRPEDPVTPNIPARRPGTARKLKRLLRGRTIIPQYSNDSRYNLGQ